MVVFVDINDLITGNTSILGPLPKQVKWCDHLLPPNPLNCCLENDLTHFLY